MEQIQEYGEVQIAGVFFHDFMAKLKPYVDNGVEYRDWETHAPLYVRRHGDQTARSFARAINKACTKTTESC